MKKIYLISAAALFALGACGGGEAPADSGTADTPAEVDAGSETEASSDLAEKLQGIPAGKYSLEKTHAFLTAYVGHATGISDYRISLTDFDVVLTFDPAAPEASVMKATINPLGVETNYSGDYKAGHADSGYETWNEDIARSARFFNADEFPDVTFVATGLEVTGDYTGTMTGDLTLRGVSQPVTLDVTFNGGSEARFYPGRYLIGFDASGTISRSSWGMDALLPIITDDVKIEFSGEFLQDE